MGTTAKPEKSDRFHLTAREVEKLIDAATDSSRNKERDRCLLLLSFPARLPRFGNLFAAP